MKIKVHNIENLQEVSECEVCDTVLRSEVREDIVQQVVRWQLLNRMVGSHSARTVSEISGTTKKPFKQKGTGRARQGSLRSVQMRGGAQGHGPINRLHSIKMPKLLRRKGLLSAISDKFTSGNMMVVKDLDIKSSKTKDLNNTLKGISAPSFLVVGVNNESVNFTRAASNLYFVSGIAEVGINVYDILRHSYLIITEAALMHVSKGC